MLRSYLSNKNRQWETDHKDRNSHCLFFSPFLHLCTVYNRSFIGGEELRQNKGITVCNKGESYQNHEDFCLRDGSTGQGKNGLDSQQWQCGLRV